jgi:acyl-CoA thioesterase FadM
VTNPAASGRPVRVGLLGGGVIGGGWAARFLLNGVDVNLYDPDPDAPLRLEQMLGNARRAYAKLTILPLPPEGALTFAPSPEEAVAGAEFVQESAPERVELKQELLAAASAAANPGVVFCSSTSGLRPSLLQARMAHPERLAVGHPLNPVYLVPLVELCAGERTAPDTLSRAAAVYRTIGMDPLVVRNETNGFLADADRLLEALRRDPQAAGRSVLERERERDDCLVAVLQALRSQGAGAGKVLAMWERGLLATTPGSDGADPIDVAPTGPLRLFSRQIPADWIDYNGHVTEARYLDLLADASDALLRYIGVDAGYLEAGGSYYTVETHISHLGQLYAGDRVEVITQVLGWDDKRLHLYHVIVRQGEDEPVATGEHMLLHVDAAAGRAAPVRDGVRGRLEAVADAHADLPRPVRAGRRIGL